MFQYILIELGLLALLAVIFLLVLLHRIIGGRERALVRETNRKFRFLARLRKHLTQRQADGLPVHAAADWLLDNFYHIEQKVRALNIDFNHALYKRLSQRSGHPLSLTIARSICEENSYRVKEAAIVQGIQDYQKKHPLKSADIWVMPYLLYYVVLNRIFEIGEKIDTWDGFTLQDEAEQIEMASCILSLISIGSIDFTRVFAKVSKLEKVLTKDPLGIYPQMDFSSRDYYRAIIERLSRKLRLSEVDLAKQALALAKNTKGPERERHIGYYLVESGRKQLFSACGHTPASLRLAMFCQKHMLIVYLVVVLLAIRLVSVNVGYLAYALGYSWWGAFLIGSLSAFPASEIGIKLTNWVILHFVPVKKIPRLELKDGVPPEGSSFVIIPTLLTSKDKAVELIKNLEVFYHANSSENLYFALVGDFKDSTAASGDHDQEIIDAANAEVERLNQQYGKKFFYFNRRRVFNEKNGIYSGWERKRGAVLEFVRLLKGRKTTFDVTSCAKEEIPDVQYVITLDADTVLLRDSAKNMIGAMLHPLNQPVLNPEGTRVREGYGLMQPRVLVDRTSSNRSLFSRLFAGQGGIDPYSYAVSDIYQDLFGEGIFTGKGIFSVDVYDALLDHTLPDNRVLSHDLLEGCILRAGLIGDVSVIDSFPETFQSYMARYHRWVRGDWQLFPFLFRRITNEKGEKCRNPINGISRWKMIDNMRRSLVQPLLLAFILLPFVFPVAHSWAWLFFVGLTLLVSLVMLAVDSLLGVGPSGRVVKYRSGVVKNLGRTFLEAGALFLFLPYHAWIALDAIWRTLYRLVVSKRNLLQWVTAAEADKKMTNTVAAAYGKMWFSWAFGLLVLGLSLAFNRALLWLGALLCALWILAPYLSFKLSISRSKKFLLPAEDVAYLRTLARRTWRYFEDFTGIDGVFLTPDNYQVEPANGVAHRTSPTNIGIQLAAGVAARDFGFLSTDGMLQWLEKTLDAIHSLPKWNGHLYNWYDTKSLTILPPRYISTVDSGNYICYLIMVREAVKEYLDRALFDKSLLLGLLDTARIANQEGAGIDTAALESLQTLEFRAAEFKNALEETLNLDFNKTGWGYYFDKLARGLFASLQSFHSENPTLFEAAGDRAQAIIDRLDTEINNCKFAPLYDEKRELFATGYNVEEQKLTPSHYDLLATEARQTSFLAVCRGEVSAAHWFRLSRGLVKNGRGTALQSWTGTMFEYLMPLILMKDEDGTLLAETYQTAVDCHRSYGFRLGRPWGISECAFFSFDLNLNYQYKAVGVPGLGLKRGLEEDYVVAPYASMLALMVAPAEATANLRALDRLGLVGEYGMYEAVDFTPERLYDTEDYAIVKSHMVHHQGMGFLSLDNTLNNGVLQSRFANDPQVASGKYLLEEIIPGRVAISHSSTHKADRSRRPARHLVKYEETQSPGMLPQANVLSNGSFRALITDRGTGYSECGNIRVNRFRPELSVARYGTLLYVRNKESGEWFGAAGAPFATAGDVTFQSNLVRFRQQQDRLETETEIYLSPSDTAEFRTIRFHSPEPAAAEIISYFEVALAAAESDEAHPAFSNLFIDTTIHQEKRLITARRRPRGSGGDTLYAGHFLVGDVTEVSYETDRLRFLGRGNLPDRADALQEEALSNTDGTVLDPVMSIRAAVQIEQETAITFVTVYGESEEEILALYQKYNHAERFAALQNGAATRSMAEMRQLGVTGEQEGRFLRLIPGLLYPTRQKAAFHAEFSANKLGQKDLWKFGVSGDFPILLYLAQEQEDTDVLDELVKAFLYLRFKGVRADLVILYPDDGYWDKAGKAIRETISLNQADCLLDTRCGIYLVGRSRLNPEDTALFLAAARLVFTAQSDLDRLYPDTIPAEAPVAISQPQQLPPPEPLEEPETDFWNGTGGFDAFGYHIVLKDGAETPLPWSNLVANPSFGFLATESGGGYTWAENSRENKLTPWSNDAASDPPGEQFLIRDDRSGQIYSPARGKMPDHGTYHIRYGQGYCQYAHAAAGLTMRLTQFVPMNEPVKLSLLTLKNTSDFNRTFSVFHLLRPVMGPAESTFSPYIITNEIGGILTAHSCFNGEFPGRTLFLSTTGAAASYTGDRAECYNVLPRKLSGRTGSGYDPCLAVQVTVTIAPGEMKELGFAFGQGRDKPDAERLAKAYADTEAFRRALEASAGYWDNLLSTIEIKTPEKSLDLLANRWLLYQTICCRLFARTAFYQAGGAYGFRDQLQDSMAAVYAAPELTRAQILRHAAHQFAEGDVQHWWHEGSDPTGADKGIRTRFSDDLLWLPYVVCHYIKVTGDRSVLTENVAYLAGEPLPDGVDERYDVPRQSEESGSVYDHCIRALDRSLKTGPHGLPLIGSGDWNDGMNTVGNKGSGESVWLGWFLCDLLRQFVPLTEAKGDQAHTESFTKALDSLKKNLNQNAWDGAWFRRAYFDDGTPLGSAQNQECQIDSLAQSWALISGAGEQEKVKEAMKHLKERLVDREAGIIKLLDPPFDHSEPSPGYIKSYVPGVRENGGQYTHAAVWAVMAYAMSGDGPTAVELAKLISPINHSLTPEAAAIYKTEPYAVAADVYSTPGHVGRGGWTWYTGAAGWYWRVLVESILGFHKSGETLTLRPSIPKSWDGFSIRYRYKSACYKIEVKNPKHGCGGIHKMTLDGAPCDEIALTDDGQEHNVQIILG